MGQDLKKLFEEERKHTVFPMKEGHEERFLSALEKSLPNTNKRKHYWNFKIAASILVLISAGLYFFVQSKSTIPENAVVEEANPVVEETGISLGDLSPDLRKVESYYVANINLELSKLETSPDTKALVDSYMEQLGALNKEYEKLNIELNNIGPNEDTITALIKNLQLRLELLYKLREKLSEFKSSKNETVTNII